MQIRRLVTADARRYWETRNQGLQEFPDAFSTSYEEGVATAPEKLALRFGGIGSDDFFVGAFAANDELAGCAGFKRETRIKNCHKGTLIGMYVVPAFRGQRVGQLLLERVITEVRAIEGMELLNLTVTHSNAGARSLYLRNGFVSFGLEINALRVDGRYYDKEYMVLALKTN